MSLPPCPKCNSAYSYEDGDMLVCPECAHEWPRNAAAEPGEAQRVVRDAVGKKYVMISALKQTIAICANDPGWGAVRPPLVELTADQCKSLAAELKEIGFDMPGLKRAAATA